MLEVKNLTVNYRKARALEQVSLRIEEGELVTIIGGNGAGKTTLVNAIAGAKKASSGEIWYDGKRIDGLPAHRIVRRGMAIVPAGRMIMAPISVQDNLKLGAYLRRDKAGIHQDLERMYELFPVLGARRTKPGGRLSGGEQQMLAIARALMSRPKLILVDEPSTGLSPILVNEVADILADINSQGVSILLIEQNARMALRLATRAYLLEQGRMVLDGSAEAMAANDLVKACYLGC